MKWNVIALNTCRLKQNFLLSKLMEKKFIKLTLNFKFHISEVIILFDKRPVKVLFIHS